MYNIFNGCAPNYLDSFHHIWITLTIHGIVHTKSDSKVDFEYNGIVLLNSLPNSLKNIEDRNVLKLKCKKYFLD